MPLCLLISGATAETSTGSEAQHRHPQRLLGQSTVSQHQTRTSVAEGHGARQLLATRHTGCRGRVRMNEGKRCTLQGHLPFQVIPRPALPTRLYPLTASQWYAPTTQSAPTSSACEHRGPWEQLDLSHDTNANTKQRAYLRKQATDVTLGPDCTMFWWTLKMPGDPELPHRFPVSDQLSLLP